MERSILEYRGGRCIADELDANGVVCLPRAVSDEWLDRARTGLYDLLAARGENDQFFRLPELEQHAATAEFINDGDIRSFLADIVRSRFSEIASDVDINDVALRVVMGPVAKGGAWWFHYDPSVLTMVVPICIPDAGRGASGELITLANNRPFRRYVIVNIIEKLIVQSRYYRWWIRRRLHRDDRVRIVDLEVGDICFFWGYRTLHANMPCEPGELRVTLILQVGRPHGASRTLDAAVRIQRAIRGAERADHPAAV